MDYYNEIKNNLVDVEVYKTVKDYSENRYELEKYYQVGKLLIKAQGGEARAKYGDALIKEYSKRLITEVNKKYSVRYLFDIRKLYTFLKVHPVGAQLTMSHYRLLFSITSLFYKRWK